MKKLFFLINMIFTGTLFCQVNCPTNVSITTANYSTQLTKASKSITITSSVSTSKQVTLDAYPNDGYVLMSPGFIANPQSVNSYFKAVTELGCQSTIALKPLDNNTEVKVELIEKEILIFPNPSDAIFNVKIGNLNDGTLEVFSVLGVKIYESTFFNNSTSKIDLSRFPSQMYFIKITSGENVFYKTILKK